MLGVWPSPDGSDAKHLQEVVVGKTRTCMNSLRNANLPTNLARKAYRFQLGPAIRYGISTLANRSKDIENILHNLEFEMLPCLGVNQHVKTEWQTIAQEFGGIELFNLFIEQFIGWIEMILQHYGTGSTISKKERASLEAAQLEIGCRGNLLEERFNTLGVLAPEMWITAVWERSSRYQFKLFLNYPVQPWEGDKTLLYIFLANGIQGISLFSLSRCRISHQAMYHSCISMADGKHFDRSYLTPSQDKEQLSTYRFAQEEPTPQGWKLWENFWRKYRNRHPKLPTPMGRWGVPGHRVWSWLLNEERNMV